MPARWVTLTPAPREACAERRITDWTRIFYCDLLGDVDPPQSIRFRAWRWFVRVWPASWSAACAAAVGLVHRAAERFRRQLHAEATTRRLRELDDRTLHDLGVMRDEAESVARELHGLAEATRILATRSKR